MGFGWGKRKGGGVVGMYEPNRFGEGTTVFSAADMTRSKILELAFNMNDLVSKYLQYKKAGKLPPFANEEAQKTVQELFSFVRESALVWLGERQAEIRKLEAAKKPNILRIDYLKKDYDNDYKTFNGLDTLDRGGDARDSFLIEAKRFLNKYIYQRGISKLEIDNSDPISDFSKQAYGEDYSKSDEE